MAIADELTKLETNRANIVAAINNKGGELADNAGLAACPEAIEQLGNAGGATYWTGHVDEAGLRYIGWDDEDIALFKNAICWDEEYDYLFVVPEKNKQLWDNVDKVIYEGRQYAVYSSLIELFEKNNPNYRYLPPTRFENSYGVFSEYKNIIATPILDFTGTVNNRFQLRNCSSLYHIALKNCNTDCQGSDMITSYYEFGSDTPSFVSPKGKLNNKRLGYFSYKNIVAPIFKASLVSDVARANISSYKCEITIPSNIKSASYLLCQPACIELEIGESSSLAGITSVNNMPTSSGNPIGMMCAAVFKNVKNILELILKGIPNYTADSYPMYFESGSTVTDDAAGTLQSLVEQCQAMGWAIYNLTINPYTE